MRSTMNVWLLSGLCILCGTAILAGIYQLAHERWLIGAIGVGLGVAGVAGLMRLNVYVAERERDARWSEK